MKTYKGLSVSIYRPGYDASNHGISHPDKNKNLILWNMGQLYGENLSVLFEAPFEGTEENTVMMKRKVVGGEDYFYVVPAVEPERHGNGPMFGGNFCYSSDSRFPFNYPLPIHDRYE